MNRYLAGALIGLAAVVAGAGGLAGLGLRASRDQGGGATAAPVPASAALIARGQYLTRAADCAACHTVPGGKPFAGGYPFKLPFGAMYSTNITADRQTGIGDWTDEDFVRALHEGVAKGGEHLYPAFPYTAYTGLSRDDAVAIKAYLFSLPAVHAPAKPNNFPFPFNQRWAIIFWNLVFLRDQRFEPAPALTPQQNRGAYLATALGHCGECHTPRNFAFALEGDRQFAGAVLQGWHAWNITSDHRSGVGGWSDQQLADYLNTGRADGHGSAGGPMGEAVENSLQYLTADDTAALVAYLRTVRARKGDQGLLVNASPGPMAASSAWGPGPADGPDGAGKRIFEGACASCHQWNGQGQQTDYAALAGGQAVNDPQGVNLTQMLLHGGALRTGRGTAYMPAFGAYSDQDLAAVANYVIGHFGGRAGQVTPAKVRKARTAA
ncbi:MAG: c-type cytochrome [Caulobacteraceae bacterium]